MDREETELRLEFDEEIPEEESAGDGESPDRDYCLNYGRKTAGF